MPQSASAAASAVNGKVCPSPAATASRTGGCLDRPGRATRACPGRWSSQIVEEYDEGYYQVFRRLEQDVRAALVDGRKHVYEAEMKERRRTRDHPAHTAAPHDATADT